MKMQVYHQYLQQLLTDFDNASLISTSEGLVASQDSGLRLTTTSRLVAYQIVKKYMSPRVGDLFILNDPENGGFGFKTIFFIAALTENLFIVWNQRSLEIDFKIPPTPLYENSKKNNFVWELLVDKNPQKDKLKSLLEGQFEKSNHLCERAELLKIIADSKRIQSYFKTVRLIFSKQFSHFALGQNELLFKLPNHETIKFKLLVDDRANIKSLTADFSQTSVATNFSCASHIIESALVHRICEFYGLTDYLSQPLLDSIKMILPPKSILSKPTSSGEYNLYLQRLISEMTFFNLQQINSNTRGKRPVFSAPVEFHYELKFGYKVFDIYGNSKSFRFTGLDELINNQKVKPNKIQFLDQVISLDLDVTDKDFSFVEKFYLGERPETPFIKDKKIKVQWKLT